MPTVPQTKAPVITNGANTSTVPPATTSTNSGTKTEVPANKPPVTQVNTNTTGGTTSINKTNPGGSDPFGKSNPASNSGAQNTGAAGSVVAPQYHLVMEGDTLESLAQKFKTSIDGLKKLNNLSTEECKVGSRIRVK